MRRVRRARARNVASPWVCLTVGLWAVSVSAQTPGRPSSGLHGKYPTMLEMTSPEFEAAVRRSDLVLVPVGAIEQHSGHLPLGTDAINSVALLFHVQQYLRKAGVESVLGPPLNIGITYDAGEGTAASDPRYPGNLTIKMSTFTTLYVDLLRSLRANGLRKAFLWPGHGAPGHNEALLRAVEEANRTVDGLTAYVLMDSERVEGLKLSSRPYVLPVEKGRNFALLETLLGRGAEMPRTTHADGVETSWTLYFHPEAVRPGYQDLPAPPPSILDNGGDRRSSNPGGSGGFPFDKASPSVGKRIADYKTARIGETILRVLRAQTPPGSSSPQSHIVRRYFGEVVDGGDVDVLKDLATPDCVVHRPDGKLRGLAAFHGWLSRARASWSTLRTQIHDVIEAGDRVVVRLTHEATGKGPYRFRIGTHDLKDKTIRWESMAIFRFENGRIAEEWVSRDELGMLLHAGVLRGGDAVR
jgi:creatinine amidohydrolase